MGSSLPSSLVVYLLFFYSFVLVTLSIHTQRLEQKKTYIIHTSKSEKPTTFATHDGWYSSLVGSVSPSYQPSDILYTYQHSMNGFSVRLTPTQAAKLRRLPGILSVLPDLKRMLFTTHTPKFLGLTDSTIWPDTDYGDGVIIGVLDTGIWPERESFNDKGLSDVPSSWKGSCVDTPDFPATLCNRKLIGAKFFTEGHIASFGNETGGGLSPRDTDGHGTHTASTAAGSVVKGAGFYDFAKGEASGMASKARIAVYKICSLGSNYGLDSDILAGMDEAIRDGVHIISISLGYDEPLEYYDDSFSIGAFRAVRKGILVSCSAGNSGPGASTVENVSPWIFTVGASTIDREFPVDVVLGNGRVYSGTSLYSGDGLRIQYPLVNAADCGDRYCYPGKLNTTLVAGKIVICDWERYINETEQGNEVKVAGGVGMIFANFAEYEEELVAEAHIIPEATLVAKAADQVKEYVKSNLSPTATIISRGTVIGGSPSSPRVASFSSRGPNLLTAEIIKPDVIAPGVNILAAWTGVSSPSGLDDDPRRVDFNILSGTSMACPHVSGISALLLKAHPTWTPAEIKSALMTTAYNLDNTGVPIKDLATGQQSTPFVHGSGHIDPNKALNPGLVYDAEWEDYLAFLCAIGYDSKKIKLFVGDLVNCSSVRKLSSPGDLNYPSFSVLFDSKNGSIKYKRVLKNVGSDVDVVYKVSVSAPPGVDVVVSPTKLEFSEEKEEVEYEITFKSIADGTTEFGAIEWSDGVHSVRSPVAVTWNLKTSQMSMNFHDFVFSGVGSNKKICPNEVSLGREFCPAVLW